MINFHKSTYSIDVVIEKLREHKMNLDFARLNNSISKMSMTTVKIFGFILDLLNIDSSKLLKQARSVRGAHRMTTGLKNFQCQMAALLRCLF